MTEKKAPESTPLSLPDFKWADYALEFQSAMEERMAKQPELADELWTRMLDVMSLYIPPSNVRTARIWVMRDANCCKKCLARDGKLIPLSEPKLLAANLPPFHGPMKGHKMCRCILGAAPEA
jgi:hypothetical protein